MAAHAPLKNECTGDKKYHNLMSWLKYTLCHAISAIINVFLRVLKDVDIIVSRIKTIRIDQSIFAYDSV